MPDAARFWDVRADKYARKPIRDMASYERTLERTRAHLRPGDVALEVGCGTGSTALLLAPAVKQLLASDASGRMVEIAREKAAAQGADNIRFEKGTLSDERLGDLRLEAGTFDAVLAFNLLHLLEDVPAALRRVADLLRPGGLFISKTVCLGEQTRFWVVPLTLMRWVGLAPSVQVLKAAELEAMIAEAGFAILETGSYSTSLPTDFVVARRP